MPPTPPSLAPTSYRPDGGGARFHLVDYEEEDAQLIAQYYKCPQPVYEGAEDHQQQSVVLTSANRNNSRPLSRTPAMSQIHGK